MPVSLTISVAPVAVFRTMPPVGPGRSVMVRPFCSSVWIVTAESAGRGQLVQRRHLGRRAVEAAGPDRVVGVAVLELDPDAGADRRHARTLPVWMPATGKQGIAQLVSAIVGDVGHDRLDAADHHRVDVVDDRAAVLAEIGLGHAGTEAWVGRRPLRFSVKLLLEAAARQVVRHAVDVVDPVEGGAGAAHADQRRGPAAPGRSAARRCVPEP